MIVLVLAAALTGSPAPAAADEIVVTGVRRQCRYQLAGHSLSDHELDERARGWALGRPVRVVTSARVDQQCLTKIAFRLARKGVRLMEFVNRNDDR